MIGEDMDQALKEAGYETTKLRIKVTLVPAGGVTRVYVSVDGGKNWAPADEETKQWDKDNGRTYDDAVDYVEETVITFLHELQSPQSPAAPSVPTGIQEPTGERPSRDPKDPKDPETPISEEEVPLTEVEEEPEPEPEEEIPEEDVPLTEIPKTGDTSGLWLMSALVSGMALLVLLKKRDGEAAEA